MILARERSCRTRGCVALRTNAKRSRPKRTGGIKLDARAEYFNVFNHPMLGARGFGGQATEVGFPGFGKLVTATTNFALGGGVTSGGQSAIYEVGGPRSAQSTLKLLF